MCFLFLWLVGGKGGLNPRKYDLLAEGLCEVEVIKIIDNLLSYTLDFIKINPKDRVNKYSL